jgi:hypothetical protein
MQITTNLPKTWGLLAQIKYELASEIPLVP